MTLLRTLLLFLVYFGTGGGDILADDGISPLRNLQHSQALETAGLKPVHAVHVGDALFGISDPVRLDESHQIAVAWITIRDEQAIRVLYRSNSQCSWRNCDATTSNHIGKGFHEFDKQLPIDVTTTLLKASSQVVELKPWFDDSDPNVSQYALANRLLRLLTADRDEGLRSGDVVQISGAYLSQEYASTIPLMPVPFSIVGGQVETVGGGRIADPSQTELPVADRLPNFETELDQVEFTIPSYARYIGGSGKMIGRVYLSRDATIKFLFIQDEDNRVMLSGAELMTAPVTLLGVRSRYLDTRGMDTPLMEYSAQIPERFGGRKKYRYQSAWPLVRELPLIQYYYQGHGKERPPVNDE